MLENMLRRIDFGFGVIEAKEETQRSKESIIESRVNDLWNKNLPFLDDLSEDLDETYALSEKKNIETMENLKAAIHCLEEKEKKEKENH